MAQKIEQVTQCFDKAYLASMQSMLITRPPIVFTLLSILRLNRYDIDPSVEAQQDDDLKEIPFHHTVMPPIQASGMPPLLAILTIV